MNNPLFKGEANASTKSSFKGGSGYTNVASTPTHDNCFPSKHKEGISEQPSQLSKPSQHITTKPTPKLGFKIPPPYQAEIRERVSPFVKMPTNRETSAEREWD